LSKVIFNGLIQLYMCLKKCRIHFGIHKCNNFFFFLKKIKIISMKDMVHEGIKTLLNTKY
jgi:hypothetical protein